MSAPDHPIRRRDRALAILGKAEWGVRFAPNHPEVVAREIDKDGFRTAVLRIEIERITGKARR